MLESKKRAQIHYFYKMTGVKDILGTFCFDLGLGCGIFVADVQNAAVAFLLKSFSD